MDTFARSLLIADKILKESDYLEMRKKRYESFDKGQGKDFENGKLTLEDLREIAAEIGEPAKLSDRILVLHYLLCESPISLTGELVSFRSFPEGQFYWQPFLSHFRIENFFVILR